MESKEQKVVIGVPHMGSFPWQFVYSALALRPKVAAIWRMVGSSLVYHARDEICQYALNEGCSHVFFLDSDMEVPGNVINRFLDYDKDIVGAMAFKRVEPFEPCFYETVDVKDDNVALKPLVNYGRGLVEVEGIGMACCLIKTDVLKALDAPFFFPHPRLGEDLAFCKKAREKGYKIFVDTDLCAGHVGSFVVTQRNFEAFQHHLAAQQKEK